MPAEPPSIQEQNKERIRLHFSRYVEGGDDEAAIYAPDMVDHTAPPGVPPTAQGMRSLVQGLRQGFGDLRVEVAELVAEGDLVGCRWRGKGMHVGPAFGQARRGVPSTFGSCGIVRMRDGWIVEHWAYVGPILPDPDHEGRH